MFARKSQTVLSDHYTKLIDHGSDDDEGEGEGEGAKGESSLVGAAAPAPGGDDDDFITLKRVDHTLDEASLPSSSFISKRKLKMGQSKKAMLSTKGNPSKLVFDDDGEGHAIYELGDESDFKALGDAEQQRRAFVEREGGKLKEQDVLDKERQREARRDKKRKRKDIERQVRRSRSDPFSPSLLLLPQIPHSRSCLLPPRPQARSLTHALAHPYAGQRRPSARRRALGRRRHRAPVLLGHRVRLGLVRRRPRPVRRRR